MFEKTVKYNGRCSRVVAAVVLLPWLLFDVVVPSSYLVRRVVALAAAVCCCWAEVSAAPSCLRRVSRYRYVSTVRLYDNLQQDCRVIGHRRSDLTTFLTCTPSGLTKCLHGQF